MMQAWDGGIETVHAFKRRSQHALHVLQSMLPGGAFLTDSEMQ